MTCLLSMTRPVAADNGYVNVGLSRSGFPGLSDTQYAMPLRVGQFAAGVQNRFFYGTDYPLKMSTLGGVSAFYAITRSLAVMLQAEIAYTSYGTGGTDWSPGIAYYFKLGRISLGATGRARFLASGDGQALYRWGDTTGADMRLMMSMPVWTESDHKISVHVNLGFNFDRSSNLSPMRYEWIPSDERASGAISRTSSIPLRLAADYGYRKLHAALEVAATEAIIGNKTWMPSTTATANFSYELPMGWTPWIAITTRATQSSDLADLPPWQSIVGLSFSAQPAKLLR